MDERHFMPNEGHAMFDSCITTSPSQTDVDFSAISPEGEVINNLKKRTKPFYRCDRVRLWRIGPEEWRFRYIDPQSGRDVRNTKRGIDAKMAIKIANYLAGQVIVNGGYLPCQKKSLPSITEGIALAIRLSTARDYVKRDMGLRGAPFIRWIGTKHPEVRTWDEMRPSLLMEYAGFCEEEGLSYSSVRLRLHIIKLAWRTLQQDYPDRLPPVPRVKLSPPPRKEVDCLSAAEFAQLLDWLAVHDRQLWGLAALMGLGGLRENEATALRVQDIDLREKLLHVCTTARHKVKTPQSARTIPLSRELQAVLSATITEKSLWPVSGELLTTRKGDPWSRNGLIFRWRAAVRGLKNSKGETTRVGAADALGNSRLATVAPHRLRATFATTASRLGCHDRLVKEFIGHKATDTFGLHYRAIGLDDLRTGADRMNGWHEQTGVSPNQGLNPVRHCRRRREKYYSER